MFKKVNSANKALKANNHTFKFLDNATFLSLYKSLIHHHLEYASVIWSPKTKKDKDANSDAQQDWSQICLTNRLRALELPTLSYRRQRADIIQLLKTARKCC